MNESTKTEVRVRANHQCEYCQLKQEDSPLAPLQIEHIVAKKHGGSDKLDNLALACIDCNLHKGPNLTGIDPASGEITEPGRYRTNRGHIPAEKVPTVERGTNALMRQIASIGPQTKAWSEAVIAARGVEGVRVLVGLKALAGKHRSDALEQACKVASSHGALRLRSIRNLLKRATKERQQQLEFIDEHPIIRPLSDYSLESLNQFRRSRHDESQT